MKTIEYKWITILIEKRDFKMQFNCFVCLIESCEFVALLVGAIRLRI